MDYIANLAEKYMGIVSFLPEDIIAMLVIIFGVIIALAIARIVL